MSTTPRATPESVARRLPTAGVPAAPPATAPDGPAAGGAPLREEFGRLPDGTPVERWTLERGGLRVAVLSLGGIVQSLDVPDRAGRRANVSLGFDRLAPYADAPYFGALIGRYGNRVAGGRFTLEGREHRLPLNDGGNSLHGGGDGFDRQVWRVAPAGPAALTLRHTSPAGHAGYPGTLEVRVDYSLTDEGEFRIDYLATTDAPTVVNLTSHIYFNLAGEGSGDIQDHRLSVAAGRYTPVGDTLIPTGELAPVDGTPFDFRKEKAVGDDLRAGHPQLLRAQGYDHNLVLDKGTTAGPERVASLHDPASGRRMTVSTTEPGVQFYSGNFLDGTLVGTSGRAYRQGDGLCLETQAFPDSPNQPHFPSTVLRPGETYRSTTVHAFSAH
ncbi:aldose epimerase family protein [Streptomyces marincola]|uniref:aldose epimerase family protein n=1 Tax=Streptomyces marincola TaxID=2878388 RepID=UPI001CF5F61F|nr:aldose epimerase family protein [Streptomyces marincola]UCM87685.1 galactose mutarotase [Streptomyces marincola]